MTPRSVQSEGNFVQSGSGMEMRRPVSWSWSRTVNRSLGNGPRSGAERSNVASTPAAVAPPGANASSERTARTTQRTSRSRLMITSCRLSRESRQDADQEGERTHRFRMIAFGSWDRSARVPPTERGRRNHAIATHRWRNAASQGQGDCESLEQRHGFSSFRAAARASDPHLTKGITDRVQDVPRALRDTLRRTAT